MQLSNQIAKHFREVYFGGNWTCSNLKDQLKDVTWKQATQKIYSLKYDYYPNTATNFSNSSMTLLGDMPSAFAS